MLTEEQKQKLKQLARNVANAYYSNGVIDEQEYLSYKKYKIAEEKARNAMQDLVDAIDEL